LGIKEKREKGKEKKKCRKSPGTGEKISKDGF
jgi:hypothetical protein